MSLTQSSLKTALAPRPVRFFEQIGSTNDVAMDWLANGAKQGSVVIADEQSQGRGRLGRIWHNPPGSALLLSVTLRPLAAQLPHVTMLGALAIYDMLEQIGLQSISIKWPNDVRVNGKKVSGILPEVMWQGSTLTGVVLGMGINVRIDFTGTDLVDRAISIEPALGRPVQRLNLLQVLLGRLDFWLDRLGSQELFSAWEQHLVTLGQRVTVQSGGSAISGIAQSVDQFGALTIVDSDGNSHRIIAGDVGLGSAD